MDPSTKAFYRILFHLRIHESNGKAFEILFSTIMGYRYPKFQQVKPQGSIGDRGNDGYIPDLGHYYQVYAPEKPRDSGSSAAKKSVADFDKLSAYWNKISPIKRYSFVFNDKFEGSFPEIESNLSSLKATHKLEEASVFLAKHLEETLFDLKEDQIILILGYVPNIATVEVLDFDNLRDVIRYIMESVTPLNPLSNLVAPDFEDKIKFNGLSNVCADLLRFGSYHVGSIENYFRLNSSHTKQHLRNKVNSVYLEEASNKSSGDEVFVAVMERLTPNPQSQALQNACLVIMAYYFESCDIFEEPV